MSSEILSYKNDNVKLALQKLAKEKLLSLETTYSVAPNENEERLLSIILYSTLLSLLDLVEEIEITPLVATVDAADKKLQFLQLSLKVVTHQHIIQITIEDPLYPVFSTEVKPEIAPSTQWTRLPKNKTTNYRLAEYMTQLGWISHPEEIYIKLSPEQEDQRKAELQHPYRSANNNWADLPSPPLSQKLHAIRRASQ